MDVEIRTIVEDEFEDCVRAIELSFSSGVSPEYLAIGRLVAETDRCLVAVDQGRMIGGTMAASLRFTVPGGAKVRTAAVMSVGVQPTHRRRGINTSLMRSWTTSGREASRSRRCTHRRADAGRFGYGLASFMSEIDLEGDRSRSSAATAPAAGCGSFRGASRCH
jgi:predicted N-acetyltransferase YhbS